MDVEMPWLICVSKCMDQQSLQNEWSHVIAWNLSFGWYMAHTEHIWDRTMAVFAFGLAALVAPLAVDSSRLDFRVHIAWLLVTGGTAIGCTVDADVGGSIDEAALDVADVGVNADDADVVMVANVVVVVVEPQLDFTRPLTLLSRYLLTISFRHHLCSNRNVLASDAEHFNILDNKSTVSFSNFSTSSIFKQSYTKYSGSDFFGSYCSISTSSMPASKKRKNVIHILLHLLQIFEWVVFFI